MAITRLGGANAITGTIPTSVGGTGSTATTLPASLINNTSIGNVTALPAAIPTGKILQIVGADTSTEVSSTSTNYVTTGLTDNITPSATSSKIFVSATLNFRVSGDGGNSAARQAKVGLYRGGTGGTLLSQKMIGVYNIDSTTDDGVQSTMSVAFSFLDNPSTTSETTYMLAMAQIGNGSPQAQPFNYGSSIVLMEVGA